MPPPTTAVQQVATVFAGLLSRPVTERGRLQLGVEHAVRLMTGCDHASVTVLTPHYVETVAASDDVVLRGDGWQHELSEGPSWDSVRRRVTVISQDLRADPRWPSWGPRVADSLGVHSAMSVLLVTDSEPDIVGSLNLYSDRARAWDDEQQELARALGHQLVVAVADARMLEARERAKRVRAQIEQAEGIVMERYGLSPEQAFHHLRQLSEVMQVSLVHLADRIVETRELPVLGTEKTFHP